MRRSYGNVNRQKPLVTGLGHPSGIERVFRLLVLPSLSLSLSPSLCFALPRGFLTCIQSLLAG